MMVLNVVNYIVDLPGSIGGDAAFTTSVLQAIAIATAKTRTDIVSFQSHLCL